jgi:hypothetical protein
MLPSERSATIISTVTIKRERERDMRWSNKCEQTKGLRGVSIFRGDKENMADSCCSKTNRFALSLAGFFSGSEAPVSCLCFEKNLLAPASHDLDRE